MLELYLGSDPILETITTLACKPYFLILGPMYIILLCSSHLSGKYLAEGCMSLELEGISESSSSFLDLLLFLRLTRLLLIFFFGMWVKE